MKNLYDAATVAEVTKRVVRLQPDAERLWGTMSVTQMVAHCAASFEMATGDIRPPMSMAGRIFGRIVKRMALGDDKPIRRNSPTAKELVIRDERDFATERARLLGLIDRFAAAGPAGCTSHPHTFFGPLRPQEWSVLMYKHLDHHLRQFGV